MRLSLSLECNSLIRPKWSVKTRSVVIRVMVGVSAVGVSSMMTALKLDSDDPEREDATTAELEAERQLPGCEPRRTIDVRVENREPSGHRRGRCAGLEAPERGDPPPARVPQERGGGPSLLRSGVRVAKPSADRRRR